MYQSYSENFPPNWSMDKWVVPIWFGMESGKKTTQFPHLTWFLIMIGLLMVQLNVWRGTKFSLNFLPQNDQ